MRLNLPTNPGPAPPLAPPARDLVALWLSTEENRTRVAANTMRRLVMVGNALADAAQAAHVTDLTKLTPPQLRGLADSYAGRCRFFMACNVGRPDRPTCRKGLDPAGCPMLTGVGSCTGHEGLQPRTVDQFLSGLNTFYEFCQARGYMLANPVKPVQLAFHEENHRAMLKQKDEGHAIPFSHEHVGTLLNGAPMTRSVLYFTMAKWGLRPHEAVKLQRTQPDFLDLEKRCLMIPRDLKDEMGQPQGLPNKRMGNRVLPIDAEAKVMLDGWLGQCAALGWKSDFLLVSQTGKPWSQGNYLKVLSRWLEKDCARLGLKPEGGAKYHLRSLRGYFTTALQAKGCPADWVRVFRGDRINGAVAHYWDPTSQLHQMFEKYGPKLSEQAPGNQHATEPQDEGESLARLGSSQHARRAGAAGAT